MKQEFVDYLKDLAMPDTFIAKVGNAVRRFERFTPEEAKDIFVCDRFTEEGKREYEILFVLSDNFVLEWVRFTSDPNYNIVRTTEGHHSVDFIDNGLPADGEGGPSRLSIAVQYRHSGYYFPFQATSNNCEYLLRIYDKYFIHRYKSV